MDALQVVKDRYAELVEKIAAASQALDPETFGKTKAINSIVDLHADATGNVIGQVWGHLASQSDEYVVAFVTALRRKMKEADEVVNRWTLANVPTGEAAAKLSDEQEAEIREALDKDIDMARVTRQFLVMSDASLESVLAAVPSKRRGVKRAGGKRMRAKFVWTTRAKDADGNLSDEEVVEGNTLTALGASIRVSAGDLRKAMTDAGYTEKDFTDPPTKLVFSVRSDKKNVEFQVVGNKIESDTDDEDDDEPEAE